MTLQSMETQRLKEVGIKTKKKLFESLSYIIILGTKSQDISFPAAFILNTTSPNKNSNYAEPHLTKRHFLMPMF